MASEIWAASAGSSGPTWSGAHESPVLVASCDGVGTKLKGRVRDRQSTTRSAATWSITASTTSWSRARRRCSSWTTSPRDGSSPACSPRWSRGIARGCRETGLRAARRRDGGDAGLLRRRRVRRRRLRRRRRRPRAADRRQPHRGPATVARAAVGGVAHQRLLAGAEDRLRGGRLARRTTSTSSATTVGPEALLAEHRCYLEALYASADRAGPGVRAGPHHRRRDRGQPAARAARGHGAARSSAAAWPVPPIFTLLQRAGRVEDATPRWTAPSTWAWA